MLTSLQRNVCRVWLVRMFGVLLMPLLAKVTEGCTTWKKGPCVIPFRVDGTLHTECLNRKACMIFAYSFNVVFFHQGGAWWTHREAKGGTLSTYLTSTITSSFSLNFDYIRPTLLFKGDSHVSNKPWEKRGGSRLGKVILLWEICSQEFCFCHSFVFRLFQTLY